MRYSRKIKKYSKRIKKYSKKYKKHKKKIITKKYKKHSKKMKKHKKKITKKFKKLKINFGGEPTSSLESSKNDIKLKILEDNLNTIKDIFEYNDIVRSNPYHLYYNVLKLKFIIKDIKDIEDIEKITNKDSISNLIIPDELQNINIEEFIKSIIQNNDSNTSNFYIKTDLSFNINIDQLKNENINIDQLKNEYYDIVLRLLNDKLENKNKQTIFTLLNTSIHSYNEKNNRNRGTDKITSSDKQENIRFEFVYPKESLSTLIANIEQHTRKITYINYKNDYNNKLLKYHCFNNTDKQDICNSLKELKLFEEFYNKDHVFKKKNFYCNKNNKPAFNFTTYNKQNYCEYITDNISNNIKYYNESTDLYNNIDKRIKHYNPHKTE